MEILAFIFSGLLLSILGSLFYICLLLLFFAAIKKVFHMDETKWYDLFRYKKGKGFLFLMILPYVITILIIFGISMYWFELINFNHVLAGSLAITILLTITGTIKFFKLRRMAQHKIMT